MVDSRDCGVSTACPVRRGVDLELAGEKVPVDWTKYPPDWADISRRRKIAAGWKCELCGAEHGKPHPVTGSTVVLTVHHLDFDPSNSAAANLVVACQRCHLLLDKGNHARHRRENAELREAKDLIGYAMRHGAFDGFSGDIYRAAERLVKGERR